MSKFFNKKIITSFIAVIATSCSVGNFSEQSTYADKEQSQVLGILTDSLKTGSFESLANTTDSEEVKNTLRDKDKEITDYVNLSEESKKIKEELKNVEEKVDSLNQTSNKEKIDEKSLIASTKEDVKNLNNKIESLNNKIIESNFDTTNNQQPKPELKSGEENSNSANSSEVEIDSLKSDLKDLQQYYKNVDVFSNTDSASLKESIRAFLDSISVQELPSEKGDILNIATRINGEYFKINGKDLVMIQHIRNKNDKLNSEDLKKLEIWAPENDETSLPKEKIVFSNDFTTIKYDDYITESIKDYLANMYGVSKEELEKDLDCLKNYEYAYTYGVIDNTDLQEGKSHIIRFVDKNDQTVKTIKYLPKFEPIPEKIKSMATDMVFEAFKKSVENNKYLLNEKNDKLNV